MIDKSTIILIIILTLLLIFILYNCSCSENFFSNMVSLSPVRKNGTVATLPVRKNGTANPLKTPKQTSNKKTQNNKKIKVGQLYELFYFKMKKENPNVTREEVKKLWEKRLKEYVAYIKASSSV